jgi:transposase-like protein
VQVNIKNLIDDGQCYQTVRELRWPDGIKCPSCESTQVIKRGFDDTELARQRYECTDCHTRFDDLTDTIFAGHHQPLKVWDSGAERLTEGLSDASERTGTMLS